MKSSVVAVGSFDGLHIGHMRVISELTSIANESGMPSVVFSFSPHPRSFFGAGVFQLLTTVPEKLEPLSRSGIDMAVFASFDSAFAAQTAREFISAYLIGSMGMKALIVGADHAFGKGRDGDIEALRAIARDMEFKMVVVEPVIMGDGPVSSTRIRESLLAGDIASANSMLGRPYSLCGEVVSGAGRGRKLGFPTVNIRPPKDKLVPMNGVYRAVDSAGISGLLYIGVAPTFGAGEISAEFHGLDEPSVREGEEYCVSILSRVRDEIRFDDAEGLVSQMIKDKAEILSANVNII